MPLPLQPATGRCPDDVGEPRLPLPAALRPTLAAHDVHRARVFGRGRDTTGIPLLQALVEKVMSQKPYQSARRVFQLADNGSFTAQVKPSTDSPSRSTTP